ncbi:MAG: hypothetical protein NBKEAIPA_01955 [Nitrospirae bacterium]|nr:MAG: hypothetical protein UZ03_NOB001002084 [Nitrospira sp. OLB3]MBV6470042.1 hypothetical protein [Nitrospirota bacterium]
MQGDRHAGAWIRRSAIEINLPAYAVDQTGRERHLTMRAGARLTLSRKIQCRILLNEHNPLPCLLLTPRAREKPAQTTE